MKTRKPAWWQLYLLVPLMLGLVGLEALKPLPGISDQIVDAAVVVLFFGSVLLWVHLNGGLLERFYMEQDGQYEFKVTVYAPKDNENNGHTVLPDGVPDYGVTQYNGQDLTPKEEEKWSRN